MYTVVLATMLAAGSTAPDFHRHGCYSSCHGCHGYVSSYSCHGCYGSCYGGYSCYGSYASYSCYGCYGGGHSHHRHYSCYGCYGGGCCGGTVVYSSCYGCCGGGYYYGCCGGVIVAPAAPMVVPVPVSPKVVPVPAPPGGVILQQQNYVSNQPVTSPTPARVTVNLPADARLWVDRVECPLTSDVRSFATPALNPNQQYTYTLKVEMARDGRTVTDSQRVVLTPGQETRVNFNGAANTQRIVAR